MRFIGQIVVSVIIAVVAGVITRFVCEGIGLSEYRVGFYVGAISMAFYTATMRATEK